MREGRLIAVMALFLLVGRSPASAATITELRAQLTDKDAKTRTKAVEALLAIRPPTPESTAALIVAAEDPNPWSRSAVLAALGSAGPIAPGVIPAIVAHLPDEYPANDAAQKALVTGKMAEASYPLIFAQLDDASPKVRQGALRALSDLRGYHLNPPPVPRRMLNDPDPFTRYVAAVCISEEDPAAGDAARVLIARADATKGADKEQTLRVLDKMSAPESRRYMDPILAGRRRADLGTLAFIVSIASLLLYGAMNLFRTGSAWGRIALAPIIVILFLPFIHVAGNALVHIFGRSAQIDPLMQGGFPNPLALIFGTLIYSPVLLTIICVSWVGIVAFEMTRRPTRMPTKAHLAFAGGAGLIALILIRWMTARGSVYLPFRL